MLWALIAGFLLAIPAASGQCGNFAFASYYASAMVLQEPPVHPRIWGYAANAGDQVSVTLLGIQTVTATAAIGPTGRPEWSVVLNPITTRGPHVIDATSNACTIQLADVMIGDVYICSGQSNMQFQVIEIDNPQQVIDDAPNYPDVRTFFASLIWSNTEQYDLLGVQRNWARPTTANIPNFSALCWLFGVNLNIKLQKPIGLIESNWGGTRIEAWMGLDSLNKCFTGPFPPATDANGYSALWNSMIHPFLPMPIFGAIWYQGESNTGNYQEYDCAVKEMVTEWRTKWNGYSPEMNILFPFGQTSLAGWRNQDIVYGFPDLRWAQTAGFGYNPNSEMQNHFLAIAMDLPDYNSPSGDIHPRYKRQIADRMALGAFQIAYGQTDSGIHQGPIPTSYSSNGAEVTVNYDIPFELRNPDIGGFELCCAAAAGVWCSAGGTWTIATLGGQVGQSVTLTNPCGGQFITGFRYAWRESPCPLEDCPIYSVENSLPAPPFMYDGNI